MKTEIYEADPFTGNRTTRLLAIETDYRFEQRDEFFLTTERGQRMKVRVTHIRVEVAAGTVTRELIVMKL